VATAPVVGASEEETSYAVGTVTVFGLLALMIYPFLSHTLFAENDFAAGLFLGTAIHDTAQVAVAALLYSQQFGAPETLETATVTKLLRNGFMVAVIPLMAWMHERDRAGGTPARRRLMEAVPLFVFGFLAVAVLRSLGDFGAAPFGGLLSAETWRECIDTAKQVSIGCLAILGYRPLVVGLVAAVAVGAASALAISAMGLSG
jgi:uncharacterized membrane protein YadS